MSTWWNFWWTWEVIDFIITSGKIHITAVLMEHSNHRYVEHSIEKMLPQFTYFQIQWCSFCTSHENKK